MTKGWHRITSGWYRYVNAAGKTLAYAEKVQSRWVVKVLPMADGAQVVTISECPKTLRAAKGLAERAYGSLTKSALARQRESLAKYGPEVEESS